MKTLWLSVAVLLVVTLGASPLRPPAPSDKALVRLDPALDELISPDAKLELVKGGFGFTEGTTWVKQGNSGYLLFSDMPANVIFKMTPGGQVSLFMDHSGFRGY